METKWRTTWLFALGAGWSGVTILIVSYLLLGEPEWLQFLNGDIGWTIYPPLSAIPQAIPGYKVIDELLITAVVCGAVFLGAWLLALLQHKQQLENQRRPWFWLSLFLLVPLGVHIGGTYYVYQLKQDSQNQLLEDYLRHYPPEAGEHNRIDP